MGSQLLVIWYELKDENELFQKPKHLFFVFLVSRQNKTSERSETDLTLQYEMTPNSQVPWVLSEEGKRNI